MREYELMYILDPTLDEDGSQALIGRIEDFMAKQGVEIEKTDPWGKRRLAYPIGKHWDGHYVLSLLKAAPGSITEIERRLRVTDGVLRFITVRVDEEQAKRDRQRAKKEAQDAARRQRRGAARSEERQASASEESPSERSAQEVNGEPTGSTEVEKDEAGPAEEASS